MAHDSMKVRADAKYRKHTRPYKARGLYGRVCLRYLAYRLLHIALLPVVADTVEYLHEDAVRLLYHAATVKASGNVDNEGLIAGCRLPLSRSFLQ